jgi:hypothetical protein
LQRHRFKPAVIHVGFMMDRVTLGHVSLWILQFSFHQCSILSYVHGWSSGYSTNTQSISNYKNKIGSIIVLKTSHERHILYKFHFK